MEYYPGIKNDKLELFVGKWVHLDTIMLSDTNLNTAWFSLIEKTEV